MKAVVFVTAACGFELNEIRVAPGQETPYANAFVT
jgi:hypothetical protein